MLLLFPSSLHLSGSQTSPENNTISNIPHSQSLHDFAAASPQVGHLLLLSCSPRSLYARISQSVISPQSVSNQSATQPAVANQSVNQSELSSQSIKSVHKSVFKSVGRSAVCTAVQLIPPVNFHLHQLVPYEKKKVTG